jgi:hypothetical protein
MSKKLPFDAFVLTPSFKVKKVTIVSEANFCVKGWFFSGSRSSYNESELFNSPSDAIKAARDKLAKMKADIEKRAVSLVKKTAALDKFEATQ